MKKIKYNHAAKTYADQDYIQTLDEVAKAWIKQFNAEYYGNAKPDLHSPEQMRERYVADNARRRCILNHNPQNIETVQPPHTYDYNVCAFENKKIILSRKQKKRTSSN